MATTITLSEGLPHYSWIELLTALFQSGTGLTSSDGSSATLTLTGYTPTIGSQPVGTLTLSFTGSDLAAGGGRFSAGTISSMTITADATTVASFTYGTDPTYDKVNALLDAAQASTPNANDVGAAEVGLFFFDDVVVNGSGDADQVFSGILNNAVVDGGGGDDTFFSGNGDDNITTGSGSDVIELSLGQDVVTDFDVAHDKIDVSSFGVVSLAGASTFLVSDGPAYFNFMDGAHLTLTGINFASLTADNFIFAQPPEGANVIDGTAGADTPVATAGDDYINGYFGNDSIDGGDGNDTIYGGGSDDSIQGGDGDDLIDGQDGVDTIFGGIGDDTIRGGRNSDIGSADVLDGGDGNDSFGGDPGNDTIHGGNDWDSIQYFDAGGTQGIVATFTGPGSGTIVDTFGDTDTFDGIEEIDGTEFADTIIGSSAGEVFYTGGGNDSIDGGGGNDVLDGGDGDDTINLGLGTSTVVAGNGVDVVNGFGADDVLDVTAFGYTDLAEVLGHTDPIHGSMAIRSGANATILSGVDFDTVDDSNFIFAPVSSIDGDDAPNSIDGTSGNDTINGFGGDDTLNGLAGNDTIDGGAGDDSITGGDDADVIVASYGDDHVTDFAHGTDRIDVTAFGINDLATLQSLLTQDGPDAVIRFTPADSITLDGVDGGTLDEADFIFGQAGNLTSLGNGPDDFTGSEFDDTIFGNGGDDTIHGLSGQDEIHGGDDNDSIEGGDGNDVLYGDAGNDVLLGGANGDRLIGGAGDDTLDGGDSGDYQQNTADYRSEGGGGAVNVDLAAGTATDTYGGTDHLINIGEVTGTAGNDTMSAGDQGYAGFRGFEGNDTFIDSGDGHNVWVYYGEDSDAGVTHGIIANLGSAPLTGIGVEAGFDPTDIAGNTIIDSFGATDTLTNIHNIRGSDFNDWIKGSDDGDHFQMQEGDDYIDGAGGNDMVDYQHDVDEGATDRGVIVNLSGAAVVGATAQGVGPTTVAAHHALDGFGDTDTVANVEQIKGTNFGDTLLTDSMGSHVEAGDGDDTVTGGDGNDDLHGEGGNDYIDGGNGSDNLSGDDGDDTLIGGGADDFNSDFFVGGAGDDHMVGGQHDNEFNRVDYLSEANDGGSRAADFGIVVNLSSSDVTDGISGVTGQPAVTSIAAASAIDTYGDIDTFVHIANVDATQFNDYVRASDEGSDMVGYAGDDTLVGGDQWDNVSYSEETRTPDSMPGTPGTKGIIVNLSGDDVTGGISGVTNQAADSIAAGAALDSYGDTDTLSGIESVRGTRYSDWILGDDGDNALTGGRGDDTLDGGAGRNRIDYADEDSYWNDSGERGVIVNLGTDAIDVDIGNGVEHVAGGQAIDTHGDTDTLYHFQEVSGTHLADYIVTSDDGSYAGGGDGNDSIVAGAGTNFIDGGEGDDHITLAAGNGSDTIYAGHGDDTALSFESGDVIDVSGLGIEDTSGLSIDNSGPDTVIDLGNGDSVTLTGFTAPLTEDNFIFAAPTEEPTMGVTATISHGLPDYAWQNLLQAAFADGELTSSGPTGATLTVLGYVGSGTALPVATLTFIFTGGDIAVDTSSDRFTAGSFDAMTVVADGITIAQIAYGDITPDWAAANAMLDAARAPVVDQQAVFAAENDLFFVDDLTFNGSNDGESVLAGDGHNSTLNAAGGDDFIWGANQDDLISTGTGGDTIVATVGNDVITDFDPLSDVLDVSNINVLTYNGLLSLIDQGNTDDTVIYLADGSSTTLQGVDYHDLSPSNFVFLFADHPIEGDNDSNSLTGTNLDEVINGYGGDDDLHGGDGNDTLYGGGGSDNLDGGAGADLMFGGDAGDYNSDFFVGGAGDDTMIGGTHDHEFNRVQYRQELDQGGTRGVVVNLSSAAVAVSSTIASATEQGSAGFTLQAGTARDTFGDTDTLDHISNADGTSSRDYIIAADEGSDMAGYEGNDTFVGGAAWDQVDYFNETRGNAGDGTKGVIVNNGAATLSITTAMKSATGQTASSLAAHTALDSYKAIDTLAGTINSVGGTKFNDYIVSGGYSGNNNGNSMTGFAGNDTLVGSTTAFDGVDYRNEQYETNSSNVGGNFGVVVNLRTGLSLNLATTNASIGGVSIAALTGQVPATGTIAAGTARDAYGNLDTLSNIDGITGTDHNDYIVMPANSPAFTDMQVDAGAGNDYVDIGNGNSRADGGDGNDTLVGGQGVDGNSNFYNPGRGDDVITDTGNGQNEYDNLEYFDAEDGIHVVKSGSDSGTVDGVWAGHDTFSGIEIVVGSDYADTFDGSAGNDDFTGNAGADTFNGGDGYDTVVYGKERNGHNGDNAHGVIVNTSDDDLVGVSAEGIGTTDVAGHRAIDSYGNIDTLSDIEHVEGTDFGDYMVAGQFERRFEGGGGDDTLIGGDHDDQLQGDDGNDVLIGGESGDEAHDELDGGDGNDTITAGGGVHDGDYIDGSWIKGGRGDDSITGNNGDDYIVGGSGNDTVDGGGSRDKIAFENTLAASAVAITLNGANSSGTIIGNITSDNDTGAVHTTFTSVGAFRATAGNDTITAASGLTIDEDHAEDFYLSDGNGGDDHHYAIAVSGGDGADTFTDTSGAFGGSLKIDYHDEQWDHDSWNGDRDRDADPWGSVATEKAVTVNMSATTQGGVASGKALDTFGKTDTITGVHSFHLTEGADKFFAGDADGYSVDADSGNDTLVGGAGNDNFNGGDGDDSITAGDGENYVNGNDGNDSILGGAGHDDLHGGAGNDTLFGGDDEDNLRGGAGDDLLTGGGATDFNSDFFIGGAGNDTIVGGTHDDEYNRVQYIGENYWNDDEDVSGDKGVVVNLSSQDLLGIDGITGQDDGLTVAAGHALDTYGDTDTLSFIQNADLSNGNDYFAGNDLDNDVAAYAGNDTLYGNGGYDTLNYDQETNLDEHSGTRGVVVNMSGADLTVDNDISTATGQAEGTVEDSTALDSYGDTDSFNGFEMVRGTSLADYMKGGASQVNFQGGDGNDTLIAGDGDDNQLEGEDGDDLLIGGDHRDNINGGYGDDSISAGAGQFDYIGGSAGVDTVDGGYGYDHLDFVHNHNDTDHITVQLTGIGSGTVTGLTHDSDGNPHIGDDPNQPSDPNATDNIDTTFTSIERIEGTWGDDVFTAGVGAGASADGEVVFWDRRDFLHGERVVSFVGGAGDDTFTDNSGTPGGAVLVDYDQEKYNNEDYDGHNWGDDGELGVVVNASASTQFGDRSVDAGHAIDIFGDIDTLNGIHAFRLTDAADYFFAGDDYGYEADGRGGDDRLDGGDGADLLVGGDGNDNIFGGAGNDSLGGGNDNDVFIGGDGSDTIDGGDGFDLVSYGTSADGGTLGVTVDLGKGVATDTFGKTDYLWNIEAVTGSDHADTLIGSGQDNLFWASAGGDSIDGGGGSDRVNYSEYGEAINANLAAGTVVHGDDTDHLTSIEEIIGSGLADTIVGNDDDNILAGMAGNDTITAGGGYDAVLYSEGGSIGAVVNLTTSSFTITSAIATATGQATGTVATGTARDDFGNTDTFTDAANIEEVRGTGHNDVIRAGATGLHMLGLAGADTLTGGASTSDWADYSQDGNYGGNSGVRVNIDTAAVSGVAAGRGIDGFGTTDVLSAIENLQGSSSDDTLIGSALANVLVGGDGNDRLVGRKGADTLVGGDGGNDQVDYSVDGSTKGVIVNLSNSAITGISGVTSQSAASIAAGTALDSFGNVDTLFGQGETESSIEEITGTSKADYLRGSDHAENNWYDNGITGLAGNDTIDGGSGFDVAYYDQDDAAGGHRGIVVNMSAGGISSSGATGQGSVTVAAGTVRDGFGATDKVSNIEGFRGTRFNDIMVGGDALGVNYFQGLDGADTLTGSTDVDTFDIADYSKDDEHGGTAGILVNLGPTPIGTVTTGQVRDGFGGIDTIANFELVRGTGHDDLISGGATAIRFQSLGGNDTLVGGNVTADYSTDTSYGGNGDGVQVDLQAGRTYKDFRDDHGNSATDTLVGINNAIGTSDNDSFNGNTSDNSLVGGEGNDYFQGSFGADTIDGGQQSPGNNGNGWFDQVSFSTASGGGLAVVLDSDGGSVTGTVTIDGTADDVDTVFVNVEHFSGGQGNDTITLDDSYVGSADANRIFVDFTGDRDAQRVMDVSGGLGNDTITDNSTEDGGTLLVSYDGDTRDAIDNNDHIWGSRAGEDGVVVNLSDSTQGGQAAHTALGVFGDTDTLVGVRQLWLTKADDQFYASDAGNFAYGDLGDDVLHGGAGNDLLIGGEGDDTIEGGSGVTTVSYGYDTNNDGTTGFGVGVNLGSGIQNFHGSSIFAGTAIDNFGDTDTLSSVEIVVGSRYDDVIYASDSNSTLEGGQGDDLLVGGAGDDMFVGDSGDDTIDGGAGTHNSVNYGLEYLNNDSSWPFNGPGDELGGVTVNLSTGALEANGHTLAAHSAIDSHGSTDSLINIQDVNGTGFDDYILGSTDANDLRGNEGDDTLSGGGGADSLTGGDGDDTFIYVSGAVLITDFDPGDRLNLRAFAGTYATLDELKTATATESGGNVTFDFGGGNTLTLTGVTLGSLTDSNVALSVIQGTDDGDYLLGTSGTDTINGLGGSDTLVGLGADDTLDGGTGTDLMIGGLGNDTYFVDSTSDVVDERFASDTDTTTAGDGNDTVISSISFSLADTAHVLGAVENLTLAAGAAAATTATGNALANALIGNEFANTLTGNDGNDTLDGGAGADSMVGGNGDDTYSVDDTGDKVVETSTAASLDQVISSIDYTLTTNVENLTLTGTARVGTGNAGNNSITGTGGNDTLNGAAGNDTLNGGDGDDVYVVNAAGTKTIQDSSGHDRVESTLTFDLSTLAADIEDLTLTGTGNIKGTGNDLANLITGNNGSNTLLGNGGEDTLVSGNGTDSMDGGEGDDTYLINGTGTKKITDTGSAADTDTVISSLSFSLSTFASVENLTLTGTAATGTGNALGNVIDATGTTIAHTLTGGAGDDTLKGGTGNDTYAVDAGDTVVEGAAGGDDLVQFTGAAGESFTLGDNLERLTLLGTAATNGTGNDDANVIIGNTGANSLDGAGGDDSIVGGAGNDTLDGGDGNDTLDGGTNVAGGDLLIGGDGNDVYLVDSASDTVTEDGTVDSDADEVRYSGTGTYTLGANLEILTLTGTGSVNGVGNELANLITGGSGSNSLSGGDENDTLIGGGGNDTLDGGAGADSMVGGAGNDTFFVDDGGDIVKEVPKGGTDIIFASIDFSLATTGGDSDLTGIENLTLLMGSSARNAIGNDLANKLIGNEFDNSLAGGLGNDTLTGSGGNDTFNGGAGNDSMVGGAGNDTYYVDATGDKIVDTAGGVDTVIFSGSGNYTLSTGLENLTLTGSGNANGTGNTSNNFITGNSFNNSLSGGDGNDSLVGGDGNDTLVGGNGNDTLDGGDGNDSMAGGAGNDTYYVDSPTDVVNETATGSSGTDTVNYSVDGGTYTLGTNVENLTLTGDSTAIGGNGNGLANKIIGNNEANILNGGDGDDVISGGAGNDIIDGGTGHDILLGGADNDTFAYSDASFGSTGSGPAGSIADNSDDFFDYSAGDKFDLTGLISSGDIANGGTDINGVIRVVDTGYGIVNVEVNEGAVLHNSTTADWSAAFNIYGGSADNVTIVVGADTYDWDPTLNGGLGAFHELP